MKRHLLVTLVSLLALTLLAAPSAAKGPPSSPDLPTITGGGWAENLNSGTAAVAAQFGVTAHAQEDLGAQGFADAVYDADGQLQARSVDADGGTLAKGHGEVVCMARLPADFSDDGGLDTPDDLPVWELRVAFDEPAAPGGKVYGSVFVVDDGRNDYMDENFRETRLLDPSCGGENQFELEPVTRGNITVHG